MNEPSLAVLALLRQAVSDFYAIDYVEWCKTGVRLDGLERSCAFVIGARLRALLEADDRPIFEGVQVDMEYNRNGTAVKTSTGEKDKLPIRPDLVVHERGIQIRNLLVCEFKANKAISEKDQSKLQDFTKLSGPYKYGLGVFVGLRHAPKAPDWKYFRGGLEVADDQLQRSES